MIACGQCGRQNPEGARFCNFCATALTADAPVGGEVRKVVSVLFCDVTGSTELGERLDPEALRVVLAAYFEQMRAIVERHGGSIEKFIGDAVMAVFGVPVVHEDDALRAVRSALEMRDALPGLGVRGRIGVMTGEVVSGTLERLATGDAVNVAARLEQAAAPGEVLIGEATLALVRGAVDVEPAELLELKGKAELVAAYRLVGVRAAPERRYDARFVGRELELALLGEAWERVRIGRHCELVSVIGDAGVGKSRLVAEALAGIEATVARGRCLPYGDGITYSPVVEVLTQLDVRPPQEAAVAAIRSLLGESEARTSVEEIAWAFRKTLEQAAIEQPLVVVFDDIHWGEPAFLDLIEHVALLSSGAPILLCCIARLELAERRATWPGLLRLEPLAEHDVDELIADRIPVELRDRIARAAGGNPLFVEEMLAMAGQAEGEVVIPPTLRALLAARLGQLEPAERGVLECGAIEGEVFHRGAVQSLLSEQTQVTPRLAALVRKGLIRPDRSQFVGEDGFRFRHLLIRDAAYDALSKATRAELHQRFATWLEAHGADVVELDEIVGHHLEQACRYRSELGLPPDGPLAAAARRRLLAAGRRAYLRLDHGAAARLLERAATLTARGEVDLGLETQLVDALFHAGRVHDAATHAESIAERASTLGDRVSERCGRIHAGRIRLALEPEGALDRLVADVDEALPEFLAADDDVALFTAYYSLGDVAWMRMQATAALDAYERAASHARKAGLPQTFLDRLAWGYLYGSSPVSELLTWLDANASGAGPGYWPRICRAMALAMCGDLEQARVIHAGTRAEMLERGVGIDLGIATGITSVEFELLAGDPQAAAELAAEGCALLEQLGDKGYQSTAAGLHAQALYALDRLDEAEDWASRTAGLGASDDAFTQMLWREVRAKVLARRGDHDEAERLAREAVAIGETTDFLEARGDANADLARVLELAGRREEASAELAQALALYEQKGNTVSAARTRARLAAL